MQQLRHWIFALYNCLSNRTDVLEEVSFLNAHLLRDLKLFNVDNSEDCCYFNDGNAEDRYFTDDTDDQARGDLEAGQEGHHERLGKAGGPVEDLNVVPPPEPTQVPPLPTLPLAGLV